LEQANQGKLQMTIKTNQPLLAELTGQQMAVVRDGADALAEHHEFQRRGFERWMTIARGVAVLCTIADRPGMSRKARKHLLKDNGYGTLNDGTVSRLRRMAAMETAIRVWRDELTDNKKESWNSPTSICNRCPAVKKAIAEDNKNRPPRQRKCKMHVETAIDTIADYCSALADDEKRAILLRLVERLDVDLSATVIKKMHTPKPPPKSTTLEQRKHKTKTTGRRIIARIPGIGDIFEG
jgi:hypothetical protein